MNHPIDMMRMYAKVVTKKNDPDMIHISKFVKVEAKQHFYFGIPEGWMDVDVEMKNEAVKEEGLA